MLWGRLMLPWHNPRLDVTTVFSLKYSVRFNHVCTGGKDALLVLGGRNLSLENDSPGRLGDGKERYKLVFVLDLETNYRLVVFLLLGETSSLIQSQ